MYSIRFTLIDDFINQFASTLNARCIHFTRAVHDRHAKIKSGLNTLEITCYLYLVLVPESEFNAT